jgi:uncharacterized protein YggE
MTGFFTGRAAVCALALALAAAPAMAQDAPARTIAVSGSGEASAAPDVASLGLGVAVRRPTAGEAFAAAAEAARAVLKALTDSGLAAADMQTADISLSPAWSPGPDGQPPRPDGYEARHTLRVTVRALDRLGATLDAAAAAGATDIGGIVFDIADRSALLAEARRAAVADARAAAALLAEAAGARLGAPLAIAEGGQGGPWPVMRAQMDMAPAASPVAPGQTTVSAHVSITFALE